MTYTIINTWLGPMHDRLKPMYKAFARLERKFESDKSPIRRARMMKKASSLTKKIEALKLYR